MAHATFPSRFATHFGEVGINVAASALASAHQKKIMQVENALYAGLRANAQDPVFFMGRGVHKGETFPIDQSVLWVSGNSGARKEITQPILKKAFTSGYRVITLDFQHFSECPAQKIVAMDVGKHCDIDTKHDELCTKIVDQIETSARHIQVFGVTLQKDYDYHLRSFSIFVKAILKAKPENSMIVIRNADECFRTWPDVIDQLDAALKGLNSKIVVEIQWAFGSQQCRASDDHAVLQTRIEDSRNFPVPTLVQGLQADEGVLKMDNDWIDVRAAMSGPSSTTDFTMPDEFEYLSATIARNIDEQVPQTHAQMVNIISKAVLELEFVER